jgi:hypothetical protein
MWTRVPALLLTSSWSIRQRRKLQARCKICQIYEHDRIEMAELQRAKAQTWGKQCTIVCQWAVTDGGQHESCLPVPANVRESLPKTIRVIENVDSRVQAVWHHHGDVSCQECVKKLSQLQFGKITGSTRFSACQRWYGGEDGAGPTGRFYLLFEFLGYRYLEVRLESCQWLFEKNLNSELKSLKRVFREHANTALAPSWMPCGAASL